MFLSLCTDSKRLSVETDRKLSSKIIALRDLYSLVSFMGE